MLLATRLSCYLCLACVLVLVALLSVEVDAQRWRDLGRGRQSGARSKTGGRAASRSRTKQTSGTRQWKASNWQAKTKPPPVIVKPAPALMDVDQRIKLHRGWTRPKQQFVPPAILDKFRRVQNLGDFVREFRPRGVTVNRKAVKAIPGVNQFGGHALGDDGSRAETRIEEELVFDGASPLRSATESNEVRQPTSDMVRPQCQTKEFLRELPPDRAFHGILFPPCVKVTECSGCCVNPYFMECAPIRVKVVQQVAFKVSFSGPQETTPTSVNVTHHISCGCQCKVKASDCLPTQTYSEANCQCECPQNPQPCPSNKAWHAVQCACKCVNPKACKSRRRYWDERTCTCACKDYPCPFGQQRNRRTCACEETWMSRFVPRSNPEEGEVQSDEDGMEM